MYGVKLHKLAHARKAGSLVDAYRAFVERENEEAEMAGRELLASEGQAGLYKGQAQSFAREVWSQAQTNVYRPILAVERRRGVFPHLGGGAVTEEADELTLLVPHGIMGTAWL